ncbi:peptidase M16 [Flavobacterium psychrophilum FPG101]|uniref:M16 family metallopeptidase n=2 Tax=Flavobacterium psychrophilum TaxID=96345 RepID=UPI0004F642C5|nr:M16 family metallopeptidase [Flavobacterium psychrophilum]AIN71728.1 peptidase M16 [Flavobacterium psychrophilum FPG101]EKT4520153.1 insulinase family protein [Flavobacterium psychrophilum]EKT4534530.1 insulinase family protein [Flavobacterium psychrophilum]EKT4544760.1 insulinase family protein [Flavobacterium psychrophilum]OJH10259.1 peptidase M16 [Flavobacterium psychrophilum]
MKNIILTTCLMLGITTMNAQTTSTEKNKDAQGYTYEIVKNDKTGVRLYTLQNGLKVYLAQNKDEPRIQTYIPVRTGSNNDPANNTGLAHYLEHMVFKGTSKIGTQNWEIEKKLIAQISDLYEQHKAETNPEKKKALYKRIDEVSQEASKYSVANEYDKLISSLGAKGTNAHTWLNETVYKNNIPANELEKWMIVEKERFSELVLRLFHTELEAVYEEYNRAQDNDGRLLNTQLMKDLFPTTPYGTQTTIGESEHLKNPSMMAIHNYFDTYYVPNNMAVVLVGDLEFDKTIKMVDTYFGTMKYKELPKLKVLTEKPMTSVVRSEVKSPTAERLMVAWRTAGAGTKEAILAEITSSILSNSGDVGLIDSNINQKQLALSAASYTSIFNDYGYQALMLSTKDGQTLEEGEKMLLGEIDKIKKGNFEEMMIPAIINNMKLDVMKTFETGDGLATTIYQAFIQGRSWSDIIAETDEAAKITKADVVKFANDFYKNNYVAVYKTKGVNDKLVRVSNPGITPIQLNREAQSEFYKTFAKINSGDLAPVFIDFKKEIQTKKVKNTTVSFVKNKTNEIAKLYYIFNMGSDHNKKLPLAIEMLDYLGTDKMTVEDIKKEFYKIGITLSVNAGNDLSYIYLSGLESNLPKGITLLENLLKNVKPDQEVYNTTVATILNTRSNAKKRKENIMNALTNYAKYGANSRFRDIISEKELKEMNASELTDLLKDLNNYQHEIFFYGNDLNPILASLEKNHNLNANKAIPTAKEYAEPVTDNKVYFANYDMVQTEMTRIAKGEKYNFANTGTVNVFNNYFGSGLSSIVFQEIRESKSLAYSANAVYRMPADKLLSDYMQVSIGTQANKLPQAVDAISVLLNEMPKIERQFNNAKESSLKQIASTRISKTNIFFSQLALKKLGFDYDNRNDVYKNIQNLTLENTNNFFNKEVKTKKYNTAIIGKKESLDFEALKKLGTIEEVTLEEIFNY